MNSNLGNQEKGHSAAEAQENGTQPAEETKEQKAEPELIVTDKRRVSADGEAIEREQDFQKDLATEPAEAPSEVEQLRARLKEAEDKRIEAERQVRDFSERFRHAQAQLKAETDEQRARLQRTFEQKLEASRGDIVAGLLDTLDNLKRAVAAAEKSDNKNSDFVALLNGVRATANMFEAKMQSLGLSAVSSVGEEFNPEVHEAVEIVPVAKDEDNRVVEELQTGYKFGPRLLRPARVRVGRANE
ncbi:MAG TPA: nucleotide exchange factor GrpE [Blastocatellia bacterium]